MAWDWNAINVGLNNGINAYHKTAQAIDAYKAREARDEYTKAMEGAKQTYTNQAADADLDRGVTEAIQANPITAEKGTEEYQKQTDAQNAAIREAAARSAQANPDAIHQAGKVTELGSMDADKYADTMHQARTDRSMARLEAGQVYADALGDYDEADRLSQAKQLLDVRNDLYKKRRAWMDNDDPDVTAEMLKFSNSQLGDGQRYVAGDNGTFNLVDKQGKVIQPGIQLTPEIKQNIFNQYAAAKMFDTTGDFDKYLANEATTQKMAIDANTNKRLSDRFEWDKEVAKDTAARADRDWKYKTFSVGNGGSGSSGGSGGSAGFKYEDTTFTDPQTGEERKAQVIKGKDGHVFARVDGPGRIVPSWYAGKGADPEADARLKAFAENARDGGMQIVTAVNNRIGDGDFGAVDEQNGTITFLHGGTYPLDQVEVLDGARPMPATATGAGGGSGSGRQIVRPNIGIDNMGYPAGYKPIYMDGSGEQGRASAPRGVPTAPPNPPQQTAPVSSVQREQPAALNFPRSGGASPYPERVAPRASVARVAGMPQAPTPERADPGMSPILTEEGQRAALDAGYNIDPVGRAYRLDSRGGVTYANPGEFEASAPGGAVSASSTASSAPQQANQPVEQKMEVPPKNDSKPDTPVQKGAEVGGDDDPSRMWSDPNAPIPMVIRFFTGAKGMGDGNDGKRAKMELARLNGESEDRDPNISPVLYSMENGPSGIGRAANQQEWREFWVRHAEDTNRAQDSKPFVAPIARPETYRIDPEALRFGPKVTGRQQADTDIYASSREALADRSKYQFGPELTGREHANANIYTSRPVSETRAAEDVRRVGRTIVEGGEANLEMLRHGAPIAAQNVPENEAHAAGRRLREATNLNVGGSKPAPKKTEARGASASPKKREPEAPDLTNEQNTRLSKGDEQLFQAWVKKFGRQKDLSQYDLRGLWLQKSRRNWNVGDIKGPIPSEFKKTAGKVAINTYRGRNKKD